MDNLPFPPWYSEFDERQLRLVANCRNYAKNDPAGVPGHNLMILIAKMAKLLDEYCNIYEDDSTP